MTENPKEPPRLPSGIGETEFNTWKHHPVTRAYLKFLTDIRESLTDSAMNAWIGGRQTLATADFDRGRVVAFNDAAEPRFETMIEFYGKDQRSDGKESQNEQQNRPGS